MKKNNITISKVLLYIIAVMWLVIGLNEVLKAFNNKDIYTVFIGLLVIALPFAVYFIIKNRDKRTVDEFEEIKKKQEIEDYMDTARDSSFRADIYNQNNFVQENKKESISEKSPALIKCPVCNKEVSNQAITCPNCGHPILETHEIKSDREGVQVDYSNIIDYSKTQKKTSIKKIMCIVFGVIFICYFVDILVKNTDSASDNVNNNGIINDIEVTTTKETTTETTTLPYLEIGNTGVVSKSQITLDSVGYDTVLYTDDGYHSISAKDNCQYVLTYITIKNVGNEIISFRWIDNDFYCQLHTSDGLEYSPTTFFPWLDDSLENMSLNPLEEKSGFVGFSVPNEVLNSERSLYLVCSGYPDEIKFKIK